MPLLDLRNLIVHYDAREGMVEAIDEVSLRIEEGEVVGLVGESGCGKTTVARAILNAIPSPPGMIKGGEIYFKNNNILEMDEKEFNTKIRGRDITLIPQDPFNSLNPLFTIGTQVWDIVSPKFADPLRRKDKNLVREKILDMMARIQLPEPASLLRKYPHQLSGGQRQRIMIAIALIVNPALVIADEPTTALDVTVQAQIVSLLLRLVERRNISVLYITHDLAVASKMADRIVVMYAGQEMESAPTEAFFASPSHPYTKKLLDCLPNPGRSIQNIPGRIPTLIRPPKGCRFHDRCDRAKAICSRDKASWKEGPPEHWIRCHNP